MKAIWNGEVLAQSDDTVVVENNHYFPPASLKSPVFQRVEYDDQLPLEGHSELLQRRGERQGQQGCGLAVCGSKIRCGKYHWPHRVLEGCRCDALKR